MLLRHQFRRGRGYLGLLIAAAVAFALIPTPGVRLPVRAQAPDAGLSGGALVDALRQGGYVLVFRHAMTDQSHPDATGSALDLSDCGTQRLLSDAGRLQALAIGEAFRSLNIPLSRVYVSPYCRTLETARLAFTVAEPVALLRAQGDTGGADNDARIAALQELVATVPVAGTNAVVVTHVTNISAALSQSPPEAGALVYQPDGAGSYRLIAQVNADDWTIMTEAPMQPVAGS